MAGTREVTTTETNRIVERCISRGAREERREETGKNKTEKSLTEKYEKYLIFLSAIFLSHPPTAKGVGSSTLASTLALLDLQVIRSGVRTRQQGVRSEEENTHLR